MKKRVLPVLEVDDGDENADWIKEIGGFQADREAHQGADELREIYESKKKKKKRGRSS